MRRALLVLLPLAAACVTESRAGDATRADVLALMDTIEVRLGAGPGAWLDIFADDPVFWMASDGRVVFPDRAALVAGVGELERRFSTIAMNFDSVRVESVGRDLALVAASYDEVLTDTAGVAERFAGYLTALAVRGPDGWRLRHAHWSSRDGG